MKSNIFLILLSFSLAQTSIGQEITKQDILKFKIKSIIMTDDEGKIKLIDFYNNNGDLIKHGSLNGNNKVQINRELFYSDSSLLIEELTYTDNGEINTTTKYYYNDRNQLIKKEYLSSDEVLAIWIFDYDGKGNKISEKKVSEIMGNTITNYMYDDKSLLIQEDKSNNTIGKEERINYRYNEKKQVIEVKKQSYYFNTTIKWTYFYNDSGRLNKLYEKSSNGVSSTRIYEYNEEGLLVSDTWESSISKIPHKTKYQINLQ